MVNLEGGAARVTTGVSNSAGNIHANDRTYFMNLFSAFTGNSALRHALSDPG
jgi:hypothetical protein